MKLFLSINFAYLWQVIAVLLLFGTISYNEPADSNRENMNKAMNFNIEIKNPTPGFGKGQIKLAGNDILYLTSGQPVKNMMVKNLLNVSQDSGFPFKPVYGDNSFKLLPVLFQMNNNILQHSDIAAYN